MEHDVEALMNSRPQAFGLVVRAHDGRLFFITDEQAEKAQIRETGLYVAYLATQRRTLASSSPPST
ncbi:hypothetical protein F6X40_23695, partial [Paraburkholderia sp. UCT31]|uniref:hypothetical protein n=1 Tax=Paraburkholderia sp. UCT31 TaxID=2615209 RepID=UPI001655C671